MHGDPVETDIAPSGSLLGLLQRGRGDGTLHALAAPRAEALAALGQCLACDPRRDWQLEDRSLYYARLHRDLGADLRDLERHLFCPDDTLDTGEERTGLALSVLGHLMAYGTEGAADLLRRYVAEGANWQWALDELAVRDDDAHLRRLGPAVLARFPATRQGEEALAAAARDAFEPRPWRLWAEDDAHPRLAARVRRAQERGAFDRWQRQLRPTGPRPGWSVEAVLDWAQRGHEAHPRRAREAPAARCLAAVATAADRPLLLSVAASGPDAARAAALRHLTERGDPAALDLVEQAAAAPSSTVARAAITAFGRMCDPNALCRARRWVDRDDELGEAAAALLAHHGGFRDADAVLAALRRTVRTRGCDADHPLGALVDGVGRLGVRRATPVLRHLYRETASSQLRGRAARALAVTDASFPTGFAVECLWDCEESTRELAARHATTGDDRVVEQLRRLAADPAEEAGVQNVVRGRLRPDPRGH